MHLAAGLHFQKIKKYHQKIYELNGKGTTKNYNKCRNERINENNSPNRCAEG